MPQTSAQKWFTERCKGIDTTIEGYECKTVFCSCLCHRVIKGRLRDFPKGLNEKIHFTEVDLLSSFQQAIQLSPE